MSLCTPSTECLTSVAYETTPPRNTSLAPSIPVRRPATSPPVTDSASPSVSPRSRNICSTTDSMVSVSTPNTMSPMAPRTVSSHLSKIATTSAWVEDFAVSRTLMPSHPLAKNASVGLPTLSSCSITPKRRSFNPLSLSPHVRSTRLEITDAEPERISKSGNIARSNISYNSYGTPGTA